MMYSCCFVVDHGGHWIGVQGSTEWKTHWCVGLELQSMERSTGAVGCAVSGCEAYWNESWLESLSSRSYCRV